MAKDVWDTILKHGHGQSITPPIISTVNPPATEDEFNRLETTLNVHLPKPFRDYLSHMDLRNSRTKY